VANSHAGRRIIRFLSSCDRHHGTPAPRTSGRRVNPGPNRHGKG
jgi:hypothetical protein